MNLVMRRPIVIATGFAMCLAAVAGCSSQDSGSSTKSGQGRVTFGPNDAGPVSSVSCETKDGLTTIGIKGKMPASVVLTDGEAPVVQSVNIGDVNGEGASLTYLSGLSGVPVVAARDGKGYTVTGTGMGIDPNEPTAPVDMPFDIAVTCP
ncbi:lipoprotein LpqH [Mycolicibacterium septicum DSM 44393]|uniref:Lipoprotein LpqH n=2 Tax=Mycolicibacterium septicum TaxID=98668 RepID=A0A7X6RZM9_9MYCO|nr:lipoprotein LpqH [Mycolicibacterium septicum]NKZ15744.1 lipoprotein LpqH [Mycolicibacterium septicum DSM 44393]